MLTIQGKDYSNYLANQEVRFVRTYKGDIGRTLDGVIGSFPASFITTGLELTFRGLKSIIDEIEQLCLSADLLKVQFKYNQAQVEGSFSCTSNSSVELRDKSERSKDLTITLVSEGTKLTKVGDSGFTVTRAGITLTTTAGFASIFKHRASSKLNGATLPQDRNGAYCLLVLGDTELTS